ncbi:PQQ-binding-like beta-propeller repeat protein [Dokdonella koreensis]|uniref:Pyrrolo-quinoline quinone repeat domain-containing protein n=1 Tax=Dokdonella koreensis DS-123 TaxID=1300342 RepID=A0A160DWW9_9GAMM|nr:PQQ-binding-like beta-propeller repeat protein [Dokdonella koreensis]ANB18780.1 Hypothetical protein I596_2785 [Dokdonella koreensis DS-123]
MGRSTPSHIHTWALASLAMAAPVAIAQQPGIAWETRFDPVQALTTGWMFEYGPVASFEPPSALAAGPDGGYYFFARDTQGTPVLSLMSGPDDTVVHQRTVGGTWLGRYGDAISGRSLADGGALVLRQGIARFSADGRLLWSRHVDTERHHPARVGVFGNGDLILTENQDIRGLADTWSVSRVDRFTGAVLDVRDFSLLPTYACAGIPLGADEADNVYVTALCRSENYTFHQRLLKLGPDLTPLWTKQLSIGNTDTDWLPNVNLVDAQGVVLERFGTTGLRELVKLRSDTGAVVWSRPGNWFALETDGSTRWVGYVVEGSEQRLECLDAATGAVVWSRLLDLQGLPRVEVAGAQVFLAGVDNAQSRGFVERLSIDDGTTVWRRELEGTAPGLTLRPRDVLVSGDVIRVAGANCVTESSCTSGVMRLDRATGNVQAAKYPALPQTASSDAVQDGEEWLVASLEDADEGTQIRVKRFDQEGAILWQAVFPVEAPRGGYQWGRVRRASDGDLLLVAGGGTCCGYLARYSADGATLRWHRPLVEGSRQPGQVGFDLDAVGDIIVTVTSNNGMGVYQRWIEKLDGATGVSGWRRALPTELGDSGAPAFWLVGNDVFSFEVPRYPRCALLLSGTDGSERWRDDCSFRGVFLAAADGDIYLWTADGLISAVSATDGSVRWSRAFTEAGGGHRLVSGRIGDDGDLYVGGSRLDLSGRTGLLMRLDRQSGAPMWVNRFDGPVGAPRAETTVQEIAEGVVLATQSDGARTFLTRFDSTTGIFLDGRVLAVASTLDEAVATDRTSWGPRIAGGDRFSSGEAYRPGHAAGPWIGRLTAPERGNPGGLAVSLAALPERVEPGASFTLSATVAYSGGQAVADAMAFVHMGRPAAPGLFADRLGVSDLTCEIVGGGLCTATRTPGGIRAHLDLEPGASAHLTATARVLAPGAVSIIAEAYAPYGWFETQLLDNVATELLVTDRLLYADFD